MKVKTNSYVVARMEAIQQELEQLKRMLIHQVGGSRGRIKLKGLWKGVEVTEEEIEEAKRAVFREVYELEGKE